MQSNHNYICVNPGYIELYVSLCCSFSLLQARLSIACCDNAVFMLWLGVGTKFTWLRSGKGHVLPKIHALVTTNTAGNWPEVFLKINKWCDT